MLGVVVVLVAAAIVITIVVLGGDGSPSRPGRPSSGVEKVRAQTDELGGIARINDSGVQDPALGAGAAKGGGRKMTLSRRRAVQHGAWGIALMIGLVAALAVAGLLVVLDPVRDRHRQVGRRAARRSRARSPANTANIPQLEATAPVLGTDRGGGGGPGRLHERADRRVRWGMSETTLIVLSVVLAVVMVVVLAAALIRDPPRPGVDLRGRWRRSAARWRASSPSTCGRSSRRSRRSTPSST